jgi:hypothetical protein
MIRLASFPGVVVTIASLLSLAAVAQEKAGGKSTLVEARAALANRYYAAATEKLAEAKRLAKDEQASAEVERLEELANYVAEFWDAVNRGMKSLEAVDELMIGDQPTAVVEVGGGKLILRVAGQNREYTQKNMPPKVALTLAQRALRADAPENKVFVGAFLAVDGKGDRKLAREAWEEAQRGGVDVKRLLPELDAPQPLPTVEIPQLTSAQRAALSDKNWSLREPGPKGWVRKSLDGSGRQSEEGRLAVTLGAEQERYQVVTRRLFAAEFQVRLILQDVPEGCRFGLFSAEGGRHGYSVDLPPGTMVVELSRQAGSTVCRVAGREVELEPIGEPRTRLTGNIGIEAPGGSNFTLAFYEFGGR